MATTSIIVNSTNSGKVLQKTITNVNPNADNDKLATWGQMLTALTDNTYTKTDRVDKANCDTEAGKQTPTLTLNKTTDTLANVKVDATTNAGYTVQITKTGDGVPYAYTSLGAWMGVTILDNPGNAELRILSNTTAGGFATQGFTVTVCLPETDNYQAASATFTVTA